MDLVKTLLVYMTVLLTSSTAFSPALTPPPGGIATPTPTAIVTQAPTWTPRPATPAPTATPALTTLYVGDRGENVRVMQVRLKELGYLTGNVDGIFGQQTLRAVERFQTYNNLRVDGIAGRDTLNKLYYDPSVVYAPVDVTAPPTAQPNITANVPIYYVANTGERLFTEVVTLAQGRTTLRANNARVPQGYVITGASQVTVTVSANGTPSPSSVTFTYYRPQTPAPVSARVQVNYLDSNNALLNSQTLTLSQGTSTVTANDSLVPQGYILTSVRSVRVTVSAGGIASPAVVNFTYRRASVTVMVPVNYVDTSGVVLYSDQLNLSTGTHPVIANNGNVPAGYTLQGANTQTVVVDQNGNAAPPAITFTYAPPAQADVPVYYRDTRGRSLHEEVQRLTRGNNTIVANTALVPAGYVLQGAGTVIVVVDQNGVANPPEVVFLFSAPATPPPATPVPTQVPTPAPTQAPTPTPTKPPMTAATPTPTQPPAPAPLGELPPLPQYQSLRFKEGSFPVYTGPGEHYFRVDNATLGGGVSRLYGHVGDWLLVGYGTSGGGYRIGYISKDALPEAIETQELVFANLPGTLTADAKINDDPIINPVAFGDLPRGLTVTLLATIPDNPRYVYVEVVDFWDVMPARGFIHVDRLK